MSKRDQRIERIQAVERQYRTATVALTLLFNQLNANPTYLARHDLRPRDATTLQANLEPTFLIRLFAEFESGLRDAWQNAFQRPTHPPMRDLLVAIAGHRSMPEDWY